jgi:hypothetical protein
MPFIKTKILWLLFVVLIIAIMAPLASHVYVPYHDDFNYHLGNIMEARAAILNGNFFWLRMAPTAFWGWLYPEFQFYAPFPYMVAGFIYIVLAHNPLDPYKFGIGLSLLLGAWYSYRLYVFLFKNEVAALLGAVLYLFSPYLLINIDVRGDFVEAFAQGLVPIVLYYAFRLFYQEGGGWQKYYFILVNILCFYVLATAHLVTFIYSSLFAFILFFFLALHYKKFKNLLWLLLCYALGLLLAAWYLVPLLVTQHFLVIGGYGLYSPWESTWLTHISTLLAPKGIDPGPQLLTEVYAGIGLPLTFAMGYWIYRLLNRADINFSIDRGFLKITLGVCLGAFLLLWSPVNVWKFLPSTFYVLQFTFRLLTQLMWLGGLLFVAGLVDLFEQQLTRRHLVVGIILIVLSGSGWLYSTLIDTKLPLLPIAETVKPENYNTSDYFVASQAVKIMPNKNILNVFVTQKNCKQAHLVSICTFDIKAKTQALQLPIFYYPGLLQIRANGQEIAYYPSVIKTSIRDIVLAAITLPQGHYVVESKFVGMIWANWLSGITWVGYGGFMLILLLWKKKL